MIHKSLGNILPLMQNTIAINNDIYLSPMIFALQCVMEILCIGIPLSKPMHLRFLLQESLFIKSELLASFKVASLDEERFLKQKSKVHWLAEGDANTKYFHNTLKCKNHRAQIDVIIDSNGILHEGKDVPKAFVDHYVGFLGKEEAVIMPITQELFDVRIDQAMSVDMIREVTFDEIKRTMFAFADDKAPGPDGFTAAFYKKAWDIVGNDVCLAV
ncbi:hypothetical protein QVD17_08547 [Tagetes erecta]|uniref:RNA-directed DNA polymerase, eukaryota, reverse transcriptase zinc-binding domain protein n=1 Tax=Tagetes erecta TaxID=13708 RepID=A0AAD8P4K4_TARER|nr:hypothetical protein QVD17_08547 [Tagetes erecta]